MGVVTNGGDPLSGQDPGSTDRVTLIDVATRAGVSPAAASLALRGRPGVAPATRDRVVRIAAQLGYRTRSVADSAAQLTIGLLMKAKPHELLEANAFYGPVIAGVSAEAAARGIDVRLDTMPVDEHFHPIDVPRLVQSPGIDGLLVLGAYLADKSATMLSQRPLVLVDGYSETPGRFATVVTDNVDGAGRATRRLIELGHRHIALVGTAPDAFPSIRERRQGYLAAIEAAGLQPVFVDGHHDEPDVVAAKLTVAVAESPGISAAVAANDEVALAVLAELGHRVPGELSLIGFDDIEAASMVRPRLDTVSVDKPAMGRLAVSMLMHRIRHPHDPAFVVMQPVRMVSRESAAPPRRDLAPAQARRPKPGPRKRS
jgi:DNA-binding LacI/PurR family transcriptional regulator